MQFILMYPNCVVRYKYLSELSIQFESRYVVFVIYLYLDIYCLIHGKSIYLEKIFYNLKICVFAIYLDIHCLITVKVYVMYLHIQ
jgi:hypothetical protein